MGRKPLCLKTGDKEKATQMRLGKSRNLVIEGQVNSK